MRFITLLQLNNIFLSTRGVVTCMAGLTALVVAGCGGSDATDRIFNSNDTTKTTYTLTLRSPMLIKNATISLKDAVSNTTLGSSTYTADGANDVNIAVPATYADTNRLLIATLTPNAGATYYDPALDNFAPLSQPIHALVSLNKNDITRTIDPFSEIAYQRSLVRSGQNHIASADTTQLTYRAFEASRADVLFTFRENLDTNSISTMNSKTDMASMSISSTGDNRLAFQNKMFAAGLYALQYSENPTDPTPAISFMQRAALDMQDGDLDGFTIHGNGSGAGVSVSNALVMDATVNSDPNTSTQPLLKNQIARKNFADRLKIATTNYFKGINSFKAMQVAAYNEILNFSYLDGNYNITPSKLHSLGAGNYTRAFGLVNATFKNGLLVNETYGDNFINDIEQLIGTYTSGSCTLEMRNSGAITLSNGSTSQTINIDGEAADNMIALGNNTYVLNAAYTGSTPLQFIQITVSGDAVTAARFGTSNSTAPTQLDTVQINCTF